MNEKENKMAIKWKTNEFLWKVYKSKKKKSQ